MHLVQDILLKTVSQSAARQRHSMSHFIACELQEVPQKQCYILFVQQKPEEGCLTWSLTSKPQPLQHPNLLGLAGVKQEYSGYSALNLQKKTAETRSAAF